MEFATIETIEILDADEEVHNLEVEEDNSFFVNGVVAHNCRHTALPLIQVQKALVAGKSIPDEGIPIMELGAGGSWVGVT